MTGEELQKVLRSHVRAARGILDDGEDAPHPWTVLDIETDGLHGPVTAVGMMDVQTSQVNILYGDVPSPAFLKQGTFITHGGSYDYRYIDLPTDNSILILDTESLYHLLDENNETSLKSLAVRYLDGVDPTWAEGWRPDMTVGELEHYLRLDLRYTEELLTNGWGKLDPERKKEWLLVESPMVLILADAERRGIRVDVDTLRRLHYATAGDIDVSETLLLHHIPEEVHFCKKCEGTGIYRWRGSNWKPETPDRENPCTDCGGTGYNPKVLTSDDLLRELLFKYWKVRPEGKTKTGLPSVREEDLEAIALRNPDTEAAAFIEQFLRHRHLVKRLQFTTDWIERLGLGDTLRPSFGLCNTVTGRLTCSGPNMQQVPPELRRVFIPRPGFKFVNVDFSTIEFYLMGYLTNESLIVNAYEDGRDVHSETAAIIYNKPVAEVTDEERSRGKTVNFSLVYGVSNYTLAKRLGISKEEAGEIRETVLGGYAQLGKGMGWMVQRCRRDGYITSIGARRRHLPNITSSDGAERGRAERQCVNFTAQYGASLLCKLALINTALTVPDARLILQVHDSGLYEVPESSAYVVAGMIRYAWETCHKKLKPRVDVKVLNRWE